MMSLSEHIVTLSKDFSLLYEGRVAWEDRVHFMSVWAGVAGQVAKLEVQLEDLLSDVYTAFTGEDDAS